MHRFVLLALLACVCSVASADNVQLAYFSSDSAQGQPLNSACSLSANPADGTSLLWQEYAVSTLNVCRPSLSVVGQFHMLSYANGTTLRYDVRLQCDSPVCEKCSVVAKDVLANNCTAVSAGSIMLTQASDCLFKGNAAPTFSDSVFAMIRTYRPATQTQQPMPAPSPSTPPAGATLCALSAARTRTLTILNATGLCVPYSESDPLAGFYRLSRTNTGTASYPSYQFIDNCATVNCSHCDAPLDLQMGYCQVAPDLSPNVAESVMMARTLTCSDPNPGGLIHTHMPTGIIAGVTSALSLAILALGIFVAVRGRRHQQVVLLSTNITDEFVPSQQRLLTVNHDESSEKIEPTLATEPTETSSLLH